MKSWPRASRLVLNGGMLFISSIATAVGGFAQTPVTNDPPFYGPFYAVSLPDGDGLKKPLVKNDSILRADGPWSLYGWIKPAEVLNAPSLVAGVGDPEEEFSRYLALSADHLILWMGNDNSLSGTISLAPGKWHFVAATFDGEQFRIYADGRQLASSKLDSGTVSPVLELAPPSLVSANWSHF